MGLNRQLMARLVLFTSIILTVPGAQAQVHGSMPSTPSMPPPVTVRAPQIPVDVPTPQHAPATVESTAPTAQGTAETIFGKYGRTVKLSPTFKSVVTNTIGGKTYDEIANASVSDITALLDGAGISGYDPSMVNGFVGSTKWALKNGYDGRAAVGQGLSVVYDAVLNMTGGSPANGSAKYDCDAIMAFVDTIVGTSPGPTTPTVVAALPPATPGGGRTSGPTTPAATTGATPPATTGATPPATTGATPPATTGATPPATTAATPPAAGAGAPAPAGSAGTPAPSVLTAFVLPGTSAINTASTGPSPTMVVVDTDTVDSYVEARFAEGFDAIRQEIRKGDARQKARDKHDASPSVRNGLGNGVFEGLYGIDITPQTYDGEPVAGMMINGGLVQ